MKACRAIAVAAIWLAAGSAAAQPAQPRAAFDACVSAAWAEDRDNFMAALAVPVSCGAQSLPARQACSMLGYLTPSGLQSCLSEDMAFWRAEMEREELAALAQGRAGREDLFGIGLARCASDEPEGVARLSCEVNVHWRTVMAFYAAPLMTHRPGPAPEAK